MAENSKRFFRRVWLFVRIVWRIDQSETRMRPSLAWEVSGIIWPKLDGAGAEAGFR